MQKLIVIDSVNRKIFEVKKEKDTLSQMQRIVGGHIESAMQVFNGPQQSREYTIVDKKKPLLFSTKRIRALFYCPWLEWLAAAKAGEFIIRRYAVSIPAQAQKPVMR